MAGLAVQWPAAVLDVRMLTTCQWHEIFYNKKKVLKELNMMKMHAPCTISGKSGLLFNWFEREKSFSLI
jgi:hypothetical protein